MYTIAVISQKGGSGKTTLALHLAVAAEHAGRRTVIVDLDPQASAAGWRDSRTADRPAVVSAQAARLPQTLDTARHDGAALALIDTAPHSEASALAAVRVADLAIIPCRPAILDLRAIGATVDLLRLARKPGVVVLNAVPPRGSLAEEAAAAVKDYGIEVAPVYICHRAALQHALTAGLTATEYEPAGKAAAEVEALYGWLCGRVDR